MLDIDFIRENPDVIRTTARVKGFDLDLDRLLELDGQRRDLLTRINNLRARLNQYSKQIPTLKGSERENLIATVRTNKAELSELESGHATVDAEFTALMLSVPNVPLPEVPVGTSEADNVEVDRWGERPQFDFPAKDHVTLGLELGLFEFERARKYAGSRTYSLTGPGVLLERAVIQLALEHVMLKGFVPMAPPIMVREAALVATGFFPLGMPETYAIERDELFLAGTSEVSLVAQHMGEILDTPSLPLRYVGVSPCFRREAGAAGRDTRGLYRVHMFTKVEQVSIGPADEDWSNNEHMMLLDNSREILRALELPHRVAVACTGELGIGQVRKHEIETWMPSRETYSETHSCSSLYEFQARRSQIRYRNDEGSLRFAHTLNNTAIASPRILIPLLENHQNADGTVTIPEALRKYMQGRERLEPAR